MFSSMIPELEKVSSSITVQCDPRLIDLFENSFNDNILFQGTDEPVVEQDYDCQIQWAHSVVFQIQKDGLLNTSSCYLCCDKEKVSN